MPIHREQGISVSVGFDSGQLSDTVFQVGFVEVLDNQHTIRMHDSTGSQ